MDDYHGVYLYSYQGLSFGHIRKICISCCARPIFGPSKTKILGRSRHSVYIDRLKILGTSFVHFDHF